MDNATDPRLIVINQLWSDHSDYTQSNVAGPMGMSQSSVNQYLNGKIPLNLITVLKFAALLNVKPDVIDPNLSYLDFSD